MLKLNGLAWLGNLDHLTDSLIEYWPNCVLLVCGPSETKQGCLTFGYNFLHSLSYKAPRVGVHVMEKCTVMEFIDPSKSKKLGIKSISVCFLSGDLLTFAIPLSKLKERSSVRIWCVCSFDVKKILCLFISSTPIGLRWVGPEAIHDHCGQSE